MNTKLLIGILVALALFVAGVFFLYPSAHLREGLTQEEATIVAITVHPELSSYQTTSLPPSSIEGKRAPDGWYLGFIQRGSGVPGILSGLCYHVGTNGDVVATGQYTRQGDVATESLALDTCKPEGVRQAAPVVTQPEGKCYIGGCSAQLCTDAPDAMSNCEYRAQYGCYKSATCERQMSGECGWTETPQLKTCLANS